MSAITGIGTVLKKATIAVGQILSIQGPSMTRETIDSTTLDVVGGYREYITGLRDGGTLSFDMQFTKTGYQAMATSFALDETEAFSLELPDSTQTKIAFNGYVTDFPLDIPINDVMSCSVSIKISGGITVS
jgi:predicted secreted protein